MNREHLRFLRMKVAQLRETAEMHLAGKRPDLARTLMEIAADIESEADQMEGGSPGSQVN